MATKPTEIIQWAEDDITDPGSGTANKIEPSATKKDDGWSFLEKPPFNWFNYWMNAVYKWITYLEENNSPVMFLGQIGNDLNIVSTGFGFAALSENRIAWFDDTNQDIRTYDFDGTDWAQVGNNLNLGEGNSQASMCALSNNRIVLFNGSSPHDITTYDFDGTDWAQVGNASSIPGIGARFTALSENRIAFVDSASDSLRTYDFDGTDWAQVGNALNLTLVDNAAIASLLSNRIALVKSGTKILETYDFDGTDWAQVGNAIDLPGFSANGLASLTENIVIHIDTTSDSLRTYIFDGTDWIKTGTNFTISTSGGHQITALSNSLIAYCNTTDDDLRIYGIIWQSKINTPFENLT